MTNYYDPIYGEVTLDDLILDLVRRCPELLRLRFVGMMNFKSIEMLSLTSVSRLEHTIGLAYLAQICVGCNPGLAHWRNDLFVAALYHDVNCGSFGHSVEWAIDRFAPYSHEGKAAWVKQTDTLTSLRDKPVFLEQDGLHRYGFQEKYGLDFSIINGLINGETSFLLNNSGIDLDNVDNVFRMAHYMGLRSPENAPVEIVRRLRVTPDLDNFAIARADVHWVDLWRNTRSDVYRRFIYSREYMGFEYLLFELVNEHAKSIDDEGLQNLFHFTDESLLWSFHNSLDSSRTLKHLAKRLLLQDLPICVAILRTDEFDIKKRLEATLNSLSENITNDLRSEGVSIGKSVRLHLTTDDRKTSRGIPLYVEQDIGYRSEVLGEDRRYLLLGILVERNDLHVEPDLIVRATNNALAHEGYKELERVDEFAPAETSEQYVLL